MSTPAVCVLLSARGASPFLFAAVESVLAQDFADFELLVMDDASPEDLGAALARYHDPRLIVTRNETNLGLTRSLNRGLGLARGRYLARMDADDICLPDRLRLQVEYMERRPDVGLLGGQANCIDAAGNIVFQERHPTSEHVLRWLLHFINPFWHPATMLRTDLLREIGGYDEGLACAQDYELWQRLAARATIAQLALPVLLYRIHEKSVTNERGAEQEACALGISRAALQRLGLAGGLSDVELRGAREVLIRLPATHAGPGCIALLEASVAAFAAQRSLAPAQVADIRAFLEACLAALAARHPAAKAWLAAKR